MFHYTSIPRDNDFTHKNDTETGFHDDSSTFAHNKLRLSIAAQISMQNMTIGKRHIARMMEDYPLLFSNQGDRRFFTSLVRWSHREDKKTGKPFFQYHEVAHAYNKDPRHCDTELLLRGFQARICPGFQWRNAYHDPEGKKSRCRLIENTDIGEMYYALLYDYDPERLYVDTLKPFSLRKQEDACRAFNGYTQGKKS